jgi:hypothetical protein
MKDQNLSEAFRESFLKVLNEPKYFNKISKVYSESPLWTEMMLGCYELGRLSNDSLLKDVLEGIDVNNVEQNAKLKTCYEYYHIDAMLYEENSYKFEDSSRHGYYWKPVICVEHENNHDSWYSELIKLSNISSKLNVVISYCSKKDRDIAINQASELMNVRFKDLKNIPFDEYLIILGFRNSDLRGEKTAERIISGFDFYSLQKLGGNYQFEKMG